MITDHHHHDQAFYQDDLLDAAVGSGVSFVEVNVTIDVVNGQACMAAVDSLKAVSSFCIACQKVNFARMLMLLLAPSL